MTEFFGFLKLSRNPGVPDRVTTARFHPVISIFPNVSRSIKRGHVPSESVRLDFPIFSSLAFAATLSIVLKGVMRHGREVGPVMLNGKKAGFGISAVDKCALLSYPTSPRFSDALGVTVETLHQSRSNNSLSAIRDVGFQHRSGLFTDSVGCVRMLDHHKRCFLFGSSHN